MDVRNATSRDSRGGSSLQGYTDISYDDLVAILGKPHFVSNGEDKVYHEWRVVIEGALVTIYDYKENGRKTKNYNWHIGGAGRIAVTAFRELLEYTDRSATAWTWR